MIRIKKIIMLKNYLIIAIRNIFRNKLTTIINILGLGIGVGVFSLIALYIYSEKHIDKSIPHSDRMYRIEVDDWSIVPAGYYKYISEICPDVENTIILGYYDFMGSTMKVGENFFRAENLYSASPNIFKTFGLKVIQGNSDKLLSEPFSIVLTESYAHKLFGNTNPMGQSIRISDKYDYRVTGVVQDSKDLHFSFNALISIEDLPTIRALPNYLRQLRSSNYGCYIALNTNLNKAKVENEITEFLKEQVYKDNNFSLKLRPVSDVYFNGSESRFEGMVRHGNSKFLKVMILVAALILLTACINYINLNTALASKRAKEIGIRKVTGANKGILIMQLLGESVLISFVAFMIGFAIVELALPTFNNLVDRDLAFNPYTNITVIGLYLFGIIAVGVFSGIYPAFLISSFKPLTIMKTNFSKGKKGSLLRQALTIFQFTISIGLIASTLIITSQLKYMKSYNVGFAKEEIIYMPMSKEIYRNYTVFKNQVLSIPSVVGISRSNQVPGAIGWQESYTDNASSANFSFIPIDPDYVKVMGLKIVKGRDLDYNFPSDSINGYLINETMAKMLNYDDPIGKIIPGNNNQRIIIGVVKDFNFNSLHNPIGPLALNYKGNAYNIISIRVSTNNLSQSIADLKKLWGSFVSSAPFEYKFLDESFDRQYRSEVKLGNLFGFFAFIAIVIGSMGLFALAMFTINTRLKEIGIRKVLGASNVNIISTLSREYTLIVLVSNAIAIPLVWMMMTKWLNSFAYRISIGVSFFIISAIVSFAIAYLTVLYNSLKAANANPIDTIKYE